MHEGRYQQETPMRKTLVATTAAAALVAAMGLVAAQGTKEGTPGAAVGGQSQPQKQGGAEKGSVGQKGGEKGERTGQRPAEKGERTGQREQEKGQRGEEKNERTGQRPAEKGDRTGQREQEKGQRGEEKNERTGQRPEEKGERSGQREQEKGQRGEEKNERTGQRPEEKGERTGSSERVNAAKSVSLSSEQKTRIHSVVVRERSAHVDRVDFTISVGTRVPRTVHVFEIPSEIVVIVPQYRGFKYIVVRDELIILDPDTLEIVAVIPA
jgi:hypothetical protein